MPKDEWGVKRACPKCATRFYDLNRDPMTCPSCSAVFTLESISEASRDRMAPKAKAKPAAVVDTEDDALLVDEADDVELDDDLLEDDDDSDVDLDELAEVGTDEDDT